MFDFDAPLFWYKLLFMAELMIAQGLATYTLNKRNNFVLRLVLCVIGAFGLAFLFPLLDYSALYSSVMFFLFFVITLVGLKVCYEESWVNLLFCGLIAYTMQHISHELFNLIALFTGIGNLNMYGADGSGTGITSGDIVSITGVTAINLPVYLGTYALVYWFMWAFVFNKIRSQENFKLSNFYLLGWSAVTIFVDIVLSAIVTYADDGNTSTTVLIAFTVANIICCALAVGLQFLMLGKNLVEKDLQTVQQLWKRDKAIYEISKENIDLINMKCHDLKGQISALRNTEGFIDDIVLEEMDNALNFYGAVIKTGNDAIDVILAEKHMLCEKNGIKLTCIIDGENLNFISPSNLYSLFGNALQNAIEASMKISDPAKRLIRLKVFTVSELLSIHIENSRPYDENVKFINGLPQTTKANKRDHGFGMRSIQLIAEKFGGGIHAQTRGELFCLNIVIPLPKKVKEGMNEKK